MADGSGHNQSEFFFPHMQAQSRLRPGEIVVDLFAGGGGASHALETALARAVDIAINHNPWAIGMHAANHPFTRHLCEDIWQADPRKEIGIRRVGWMHASPDCFPAGTMVLTSNGYRPVEEIDIGDLVLTHAGRWRCVTDTMSTERELIRLAGHGHPGLTVSAEHPFLARKRSDVWSTSPRGYRAQYGPADWVRAGDLDREWYWATPHSFPASCVPAVGGRSMEINPKFMWLVGRYLGDGWTRLDENHADLVITCSKNEASGLAWLNEFWKPSSMRAGANELSWQERHTGTAYQFTTSHQGLVVWLREHFGHGAAEKKIPGWALGMSQELRAALLEGYCSADGHRTDNFIETQTVSKALAFGIKALAASLGCTVAVYTGENRDTIQGRKVNARPIWRCRWRHAVDEAHRQTFRDENHEWAPIRKTTHSVGYGRVYNLSVHEDESYVVEGIVVHNCTHFSQAKGGQPRSRATRSLSWVVLRWAGAVRPRIISLENVKEILKWGPLIAKRDSATGRVMKLDGTVAARGERVPVEQQFLIPDKGNEGRTWRHFVGALRTLGYVVEWKRLKACDFGAGTSRERLFMVARCDGEPICWPEPTHGPGRAQPYVSAADCIDWSVPCPSIFERKKPLADATLRRIARGIKRYVLDTAEPFIVGVGGRMGQTMERPVSEPTQTLTAKADSCVCVPSLVQCANASSAGIADAAKPLGTVTAWPKGGSHAVSAPILAPLTHQGSDRVNDPTEPLRTITGANRGEIAVASASLVKFRGASDGGDVQEPLPTITSGAGAVRPAGAAHALGVITAHLEQANGGFAADGPGHDARDPLSTITGTGSQQRVVSASMVTMRGDNTGAAADEPVRTLSAGGEHHAVVEYTLSPEHEAGALRVASFLINYYGNGQALGLPDPVDTITTRDRLALVTVTIKGTPYVIVDIGLRMLQRHELFRAQGFPPGYIIDRTADGRKLSASRSVAMVGNSVSPPPLRAIAIANLDPATHAERIAA